MAANGSTPMGLTRRSFLKGSATAAAVATSGVLAGCSSGKSASSGGGKIRLWHVLSPQSAKPALSALQELTKRYQQRHRNVSFDLQYVEFSEAGAFQEKVNAAAASKNPPDIVMLSGPKSYAFTGAAKPLNDYLSSSSIKEKDYIPGQWARCTWDGQVYGIPIGADANALFWWNRDVFKKNHLNPDSPPETWDDLRSLSERLFKKKGNKIESAGFLPTYGQAWPLVFYYLEGPTDAISPGKHAKVLFNDDAGVKGLQFQVELSDLNGGAKVMNSFANGFQAGAQDPFITGQVATECNGNWQQSFYKQYAPHLNYGVSTMPLPPGGVRCTTSGGFAWCIPQKSTNADEAWKFIEFASAPEQHLTMVKGWSTNPARLDLLDDPYFRDDPVRKVAIDAIRNSRGWMEGPWGPVAWQAYCLDARDNAIYHRMSVKKALDGAAKTVQQAIDQVG